MNYKSMLVLNRTSLVSKNSIAELSVCLTKVGCLYSVCVCVHACMRACVRACVRACMRVCVCVHHVAL